MKRLLLFISALFICTLAIAHTINWHVDGQIIETTTCDSGDSITPPTAPYKYGYHFLEWEAYTPIEYLEFTGTQKISSQLGTSLPYFHAKFGVSISKSVQMDISNSKSGHIYYVPSNFCIWTGSATCNSTTISTGIKYDIEYTIIPTNITIKVNNSSRTINGNFNVSETKNFDFGSVNSSSNRLFYGKIYYAQLFDYNGDLLSDMIPVLNSNNVPCMYDKVSKQFFYNDGTGDFIAGPNIE